MLNNSVMCSCSCRTLNKFADDKYIIQRASLDDFPVVPWTPNNRKQAIFSERCADLENPEALYRRGIVSVWISLYICIT